MRARGAFVADAAISNFMLQLHDGEISFNFQLRSQVSFFNISLLLLPLSLFLSLALSCCLGASHPIKAIAISSERKNGWVLKRFSLSE